MAIAALTRSSMRLRLNRSGSTGNIILQLSPIALIDDQLTPAGGMAAQARLTFEGLKLLSLCRRQLHSAEVVEVLKRDGCAVFKSLADRTICDQVEQEMAQFLDSEKDKPPINAPSGYEDFPPAETRRIVGIIAKSHAYRTLVTHPLVMAVCDAMLLPSCASYQLCTTTILVPERFRRKLSDHG